MTVAEILQKAAARGRQLGLPYSGALTPAEAYEVWRGMPGAKLVDVRQENQPFPFFMVLAFDRPGEEPS